MAPWSQWRDIEKVVVRPWTVSLTTVHSPLASGADKVMVAGT
jgi:hypothetical protein